MAASCAALILTVLAGCGGGDQALTSSEKVRVSDIEYSIAATVASSARLTQTERGIDWLIRLYREKPRAVYDDGDTRRSPRQLLEDAASDLQPYRPLLAAKIDRALGG